MDVSRHWYMCSLVFIPWPLVDIRNNSEPEMEIIFPSSPSIFCENTTSWFRVWFNTSGSGYFASSFGIFLKINIHNIKYFPKYRVDTCGSTISQNISYIQNLAYPSSITSASTSCAYTISGSEDICQIRLDFVSVVTGDASAGTCSDSITATSPTIGGSNALPTLCGTLTGSHSK